MIIMNLKKLNKRRFLSIKKNTINTQISVLSSCKSPVFQKYRQKHFFIRSNQFFKIKQNRTTKSENKLQNDHTRLQFIKNMNNFIKQKQQNQDKNKNNLDCNQYESSDFKNLRSIDSFRNFSKNSKRIRFKIKLNESQNQGIKKLQEFFFKTRYKTSTNQENKAIVQKSKSYRNLNQKKKVQEKREQNISQQRNSLILKSILKVQQTLSALGIDLCDEIVKENAIFMRKKQNKLKQSACRILTGYLKRKIKYYYKIFTQL